MFHFSSYACNGPGVNKNLVEILLTVVPISGIIVQIANATGIGYRHDRSVRFSNKLTYALNH